MDKLQLEVLLKAIDQATAPIRAIREGSGEMAKAVREAKAALKELEKQQGLVDKFREVKLATEETETQWKAATDRVRSLKLEMDATDEPTRKMARAFEVAKKEAGELKDKHGELLVKQQGLRSSLSEVGIGTINLAEHQRKLHGDIAQATAAFERQSAALEAHGERMRKTIAAQAEYRKSIDFRNKLATGGAVTMATGAAMGAPFVAASREFVNFEQAMMGVAKQMEGAKDANGNYTQTYHDMARAIKAMSEQIPMAANEIAAIVEAGARMGIQGKENLLIYARQTAIMSSALDLPVEQTGKSMATIAGLYGVPIANIRELGDTINWLDENARSNSGDIIDVMQRVSGTMSGVMDYRQTAALASTFLSLGASAEVAGSATNAMVRELSVANMQSDRFQDGMKLLKLNSQAIQSGMATDATGTIIKVLEAIKALPKEQQIEGATRIFGKEFGDDAAKLANNLVEYRNQLAWTKDAKAEGSMDREMGSQLKGQRAQEQLLSNAMDNLASDIGGSLKAPLVSLIGDIRGVIHALRDWIAAHPDLVAVLSVVGAGVAAITTGAGALAIALAGLLGPYAAVKLAMTKLGVASPELVGKLGSILGPIGKITAAFTAGYAAGTLLNDGINALIQKLTGKQNLGFWIYDLVQAVKAKYGELTAWLKKLPAEMIGIGTALVDGIISGIKARMAALKSTITGVGQETVSWLKNTLGIKSPSKVFQELGIYTMQGLEQGITGGQGAPLAAIARMSKQLAGAGAGMMIGTAALAGGIDNRPPLAAGAMGGGYTVINHITIQAAPGMNEKSLAQEVTRQIDELERTRAARSRSRFGDRA